MNGDSHVQVTSEFLSSLVERAGNSPTPYNIIPDSFYEGADPVAQVKDVTNLLHDEHGKGRNDE